MFFSKNNYLQNFKTIFSIDKELLINQKKLFNLKIEKKLTKEFKSHLISKLKLQIAQLNFKKSILN